MASHGMGSTACSVPNKGGGAGAEPHPLAKSPEAILKEIDSQYKRARDTLGRTLPVTEVKKRVLTMLADRHLQYRDNYVRELAALAGGEQ
ncbi:hypothetical protein [Microvirga sp. VF16]|uniref:hypothetical protein n=1 Tax=Microvirga sp. VF16 TaxID=2807101 RepID=UPI00193E6699|nr:hypothetical protein [Microvirga sp. VF16]QRM35584.1 hypothetical protein JO965_42925 [Microvirga sp. VF16]